MKLKNLQQFRKLHNKKGSALIVSYFVSVLLLGLGAAFMRMSIADAFIAERQKATTVSFHIAEAGIERALYDLRQDFVLSGTLTPNWGDGTINGITGPTAEGVWSTLAYNSETPDNTFNGGAYTVEVKIEPGTEDMWVRATGGVNGVTHQITTYVTMIDISPWGNAIYAGRGGAGTTINGNVNIRGSVHVLGNGLAPGDYAIDLGGTAELIANNYNGLDPVLEAKVPALPTTIIPTEDVNGNTVLDAGEDLNGNGILDPEETVETLFSQLRIKKGLVGLNGNAYVGEINTPLNGEKETVDGVFTNDGFGGNQGAAHVYSDNGTNNVYDLGDTQFPSLLAPYEGYANYRDYLVNDPDMNAYVVSSDAELTQLANVMPTSSFSIGDANNYITMDGAGNMTIQGVVVIDPNAAFGHAGNLGFYKDGTEKTITYSGTGTFYVSGDAAVSANLITDGANSFPTSIIGVMTPYDIHLGVGAQIDVMGLFFGEDTIAVDRQTNIMGTIVSNYFDMGTNVPSIYQVPDTAFNLPIGLIAANARWYIVVAWIKS